MENTKIYKNETVKKYTYIIYETIMIYAAINIIGFNVLVSLVNKNGDIVSLLNKVMPFSLANTAVFFAVLFIVHSLFKIKLKKHNLMLCYVFSLIYVFGYFSEYSGDTQIFDMFSGHKSLLYVGFFIAWLGTAEIIVASFKMIKYFIEKMDGTHFTFSQIKNIEIKTTLVLFVIYSVVALLRYPAGFESDAYHQILQILGYETLDDHWPVISSASMGIFVAAGMKIFHSQNIGIFIYVLLQCFLASLLFSHTLKVMCELKVACWWRMFAFLNYCLVPIYMGFITSVVKDTYFSLASVWFVCLLIERIYLEKENSLLLVLSGVLMCVLRKNGLYIIVLTFIPLLIYQLVKKDSKHKKISMSLAIVILISLVFSIGIQPRLIKEKAWGAGEAMSLVLQQTARYYIMYPEDVTDSEDDIINNVMDVNASVTNYDPIVSDPVKITFHGEADDLMKYMVVWFKMFFRHPDAYLRATFDCVGGFFYPDMKVVSSVNSGMWRISNYDDALVFKIPHFLVPIRSALMGLMLIVENLPFMIPLCSAGCYTWVLTAVFTDALCKKQKRELFICLPLVLAVLVCIASPTFSFGGFRYALPYIWAMPLVLGLTKFRR